MNGAGSPDKITEQEPGMRRLIMWNTMTLDGFFEGAQPWALDWYQYL